MQRLRRSISISRYRSIEDEDDSHRRSRPNNEANSRGSFDTFVIPDRTRYPSNPTPAPKSIDIRIAENLLRENPKARNASKQGFEGHPSPSACADGKHSSINPFQSPFDSQPGSRVVSSGTFSDWSGFSFTHSSLQSYASHARASAGYLDKYNHLAAKYGLGNLSTFKDTDAGAETGRVESKRKFSPRKSIWGRLVRSSSSSNVKDLKPPRLSHKGSIGSILSWRPKPVLRCQSLEETYRLGGVSIVHLPSSYCTVELIVPVYLAATANYLARYGQGTAGIFRIPGQSSTVNTLYDHYAAQISSAEKSTDLIHTVVGASDLPTEIRCTIHDVASAFKRFLWNMPGGILGSLPLFNSLHGIASLDPVRHQEGCIRDQASLIALALLCTNSARRIALISTVFGLLALLRREATALNDSTETSRFTPVENINSKALGVIFAPLLLGSLTDKIDVGTNQATPLLQSSYATPTRGMFRYRKSPRSTGGIEQSPGIAAGLRRTSAAALVVEMLVCRWREVVQEVKSLEVSSLPGTTSVSSSQPDKDVMPIRRLSGNTRNRNSNILESLHPQQSQESPPNQAFNNVPHVHYMPTLQPMKEPCSDAVVCDQLLQPQTTESKHTKETRSLELQPWTSEDVNHDYPNPSYDTDTPSVELRLPKTPQLNPHALTWWEKESWVDVKSCGNPLKSSVSSVERTSESTLPLALSSPTRLPSIVYDSVEPLGPTAVNAGDETSDADSEACSENETLDICLALDLPAIIPAYDSSKAQVPAADVSCSTNTSYLPVDPRVTSPSFVPHFATRAPSSYVGSKEGLVVSDGYQLIAEGNFAKLGRTKSSDRLIEPLQVQPQKDGFFTPILPTKNLSPSMIPKPVSDSFCDRRQRASIIDKEMRSKHPASADQNDTARKVIEDSGCTIFQGRRTGQKCTIQHRFKASLEPSNAEHSLQASSEALYSPAPHPLPFAEEPPVARRLEFKTSQDIARTKPNTSNGDIYTDETCVGGSKTATGLLRRENVGTLYKEIRRLKKDSDDRFEENLQLRQQLDAVKRFRSAGTLSHQLREKEREVRMWRHRAEWAEATLFRQRGSSDLAKQPSE